MLKQFINLRNTRTLEKPFHELMDLNAQLMQNFSFTSPTELLNSHPEDLLEKNLLILIQNSHKTLDYMQNILQIMEDNWFNMYQMGRESSQELKDQYQRFTRNIKLNDVKNNKRATSNGASDLKEKSKTHSKHATPTTPARSKQAKSTPQKEA